jgi:hypothetical protein
MALALFENDEVRLEGRKFPPLTSHQLYHTQSAIHMDSNEQHKHVGRPRELLFKLQHRVSYPGPGCALTDQG